MLRRSLFTSPLSSCSASTTLTVVTATTSTTTSLLLDSHRHASKATGSNTKYQANNAKNNEIGFRVYLGQPIRKGESIAFQRHSYDHKWGAREPEYQNGRNVHMSSKTKTLTAERDGIPTIRKSDINPEYEWVDLESDIQKVYRTKELRKHFKDFSGRGMGKLSKMSAQHNRTHYQTELKDLKEPDWRQRVIRDTPLSERFPDPNLLTRGIVMDISPKAPYYYE